MNFYEILKASKGLPTSDYMAILFARKIGKNVTVSGVPCVLEKSAGKPVISYKIYGNSVQNGTPTPENPVEVQSVGELITEGENSGKYEIPVVTKSADYEPTKINILLNQPLRKISNYADEISDGRVIRKINKIQLNSEMKWGLQSINNFGIANFRCIVLPAGEFSGWIASNRFVRQTSLIAETKSPGVLLADRSSLYIRLPAALVSTVEDFKKWLDEHPTYIEYAMAKTTEETIEMPEIPTFYGTTTIEVNTEIQPSGMEITYKSRR